MCCTVRATATAQAGPLPRPQHLGESPPRKFARAHLPPAVPESSARRFADNPASTRLHKPRRECPLRRDLRCPSRAKSRRPRRSPARGSSRSAGNGSHRAIGAAVGGRGGRGGKWRAGTGRRERGGGLVPHRPREGPATGAPGKLTGNSVGGGSGSEPSGTTGGGKWGALLAKAPPVSRSGGRGSAGPSGPFGRDADRRRAPGPRRAVGPARGGDRPRSEGSIRRAFAGGERSHGPALVHGGDTWIEGHDSLWLREEHSESWRSIQWKRSSNSATASASSASLHGGSGSPTGRSLSLQRSWRTPPSTPSHFSMRRRTRKSARR